MDEMIKQVLETAWKKPVMGSFMERANLHFEENHFYVDCSDPFGYEQIRRGRFVLVRMVKELFGDKMVVHIRKI